MWKSSSNFYSLHDCVPPNSQVRILTPYVLVLEDEVFGGRAFKNGIRALLKETPEKDRERDRETPESSLALCENNEISTTLKMAFTQPCCHPDLGLPSLTVVIKWMSVVYATQSMTLLQQPKQTKAK